MYYVYRFLDKNKNIIYVGKSKQQLKSRFATHSHLPDGCYSKTRKIEYITCKTESDMSIKEIYYINKYYQEGLSYNVLDTTELPFEVEFNDKWKQYKGSLGENFPNSLNYIKGYAEESKVKYNKDGSIDKRKTNKVAGVSSFAESMDNEEIDLIINYYIQRINDASNGLLEQLYFRDLVLFVLGINTPFRPNDILNLKYKDLFNSYNQVKMVELKINSGNRDETLIMPLKSVVKKILNAYRIKYNLSYDKDKDINLFLSRKNNKVLSSASWWKKIKEAQNSLGINKNLGTESIRKTFFMNIYNLSEDKLKALQFIGVINGKSREAKIIEYLGLHDAEIDYDFYFSEQFSLGEVDLSKINCLSENNNTERIYYRKVKVNKKTENTKNKSTAKRKTSTYISPKGKCEAVRKHIEQHISLEDLSSEYNVSVTTIYNWVRAYKRHGKKAFSAKSF